MGILIRTGARLRTGQDSQHPEQPPHAKLTDTHYHSALPGALRTFGGKSTYETGSFLCSRKENSSRLRHDLQSPIGTRLASALAQTFRRCSDMSAL